MTRGICVVLTERGFWCCEAVLVDRIFISTSFGVAGILSIIVEMLRLCCFPHHPFVWLRGIAWQGVFVLC